MAGEVASGPSAEPVSGTIAGQAMIAAWDGGSALSVVVRNAPALMTGYLFCEGDDGRHRLACRRRLSAEGDLALDVRGLQPGAGAVALLRRASGEVTTFHLRFDASATPEAGAVAPVMAIGGMAWLGVNRLEDALPGGLARLLVGPFLSDEDRSARALDIALTATQGQVVIDPPAASAARVMRVAFVSRRAGWRFIEPDEEGRIAAPRPGEGEAILLLGAPGAALSLASSGLLASAPGVPARELALIAAEDGGLVAVALDAALRASTGSSLARLDGSGAGRALVLPGQALPVEVRTPFSPYDPNVQAARRAVQEAASAGAGWPDPAPWTHPFAAGGWPVALTEAVAGLSPADQARLVEWTLLDPLLGRLMAAVRLVPDRDLAPADADRIRQAIVPLSAPDAPDMLRAAAVSVSDPAARRRVLEVAGELGRGWLPLSLAEAALAAAQVKPDGAPGQLPIETARAARALIGRWEELTGDIGLIASFDPAQDPLRGAGRLVDGPGLDAALAAVPVLARIATETDRQVANLLAAEPDAADMTAALKAVGRYLAMRHLVALADVAAGLAIPPGSPQLPDEDDRLRLGVLRRMRAALPEGIAAYLALAGAGSVPPVERQLAERWGQP